MCQFVRGPDERLLEQMRSEFVATLSHELRTPLAAVAGAVKTLRRSDVDFDRHAREPLLDIAAEQTERLTETADRILLVGQIDGGPLPYDDTEVDVNALLRRLVAAYGAAAPASPTVKAELANPPPVRALAGCVLDCVLDQAG